MDFPPNLWEKGHKNRLGIAAALPFVPCHGDPEPAQQDSDRCCFKKMFKLDLIFESGTINFGDKVVPSRQNS